MIFERIGRIFAPKEDLLKGRSMVGYSRRGFLGMAGAAAISTAIPKPGLQPYIVFGPSVLFVNLFVNPIISVEALYADGNLIPRDYYELRWPVVTRQDHSGVYIPEAPLHARL